MNLFEQNYLAYPETVRITAKPGYQTDWQEKISPVPDIPEGFVDLGFASGTLWYTKNIGATNGDTAESWYGDYYQWGSTTPLSISGTTVNPASDWDLYPYANGAENKLTKYCPTDKSDYWDGTGDPDNILALESSDNIAIQTNSAWKMPTKEQFEELIAGTISTWETDYQGISGLNGRKFTKIISIQPAFKNVTLYSEMFDGELTEETWTEIAPYSLEEINALIGGQDIRTIIFKDAEYTVPAVYGTDYEFAVKQVDPTKFIFMPAIGYCRDSSLDNVGSYASYWSVSLDGDYPNDAWKLNFNSDNMNIEGDYRDYGQSVRPVITPTTE